MKHKQIFWNATTTMIQVVGSAGTLFILYRFLIRTIGVEGLGIWSLVLATTSLVTLANQGFSNSIVKFVAKYAALDREDITCELVDTAILTIAAILTGVCFVFYPAVHWGLRIVLPVSRVAAAATLLPWAFLSLWINVVGGVLLAALAGHERITFRNYVVLGGSLFYLLLTFIFVPRYGLLGLAYAQTTNALVCLVATRLLLRIIMPQLSVIPRRWNASLFHEMWAYGVHFQFVTITQAIREPITKALLAKFGGLAMTGLYDVASRWVFTFRELIVQANLVLVPTISGLRESSPHLIPEIYLKSYRLIFFLAVPTFAFLVVISPVVSYFWLGHYEPVFVTFVGFLACGWLANILSNPAYAVDLGTGDLRWVSIGCVVTVLLNGMLGYAAGRLAGGTAVVAASAISLALGYAVVLAAYHLENRVPFSDLLPEGSRGILAVSALAIVVFFSFFCHADLMAVPPGPVVLAALCLLPITMFLTMWFHPMRRQLVNWIAARLPA